MPELEPLIGLRVTADPVSLDAATWPAGSLVMRLAHDEALAIGATEIAIDDPFAIIEPEGAYMGLNVATDTAERFLEAECAWELPSERPTFAQGRVAGLPVKMWLQSDTVLFVVPASFAVEFAERFP